MLKDKVLKIVKKHSLLFCLDKVLVGVSGGPDSLALLYLLNELKVKLGITIVVGHLNHGLRARASDSDEKFVEDVARCLGLDFVSKKISFPGSKSKLPSEESLRKARYDFLFSVAKKQKVDKIALGHTLDDQAETVLMRLIRGSGLYGLISILPKRKIDNFCVIRPMIEISRKEISAYLKEGGIKPRIDKTNFKMIFLRNRVRHKVLRELTKINPKIKETLARFAQQAAVDYDYLLQQSKRFIKSKNNSLVTIDLEKFPRLHTALKRMILRVALEKISGKLRTFTNKHWEEVGELIESRPSGSIVNLTKGIQVKKDRKNLFIYSNKKAARFK